LELVKEELYNVTAGISGKKNCTHVTTGIGERRIVHT